MREADRLRKHYYKMKNEELLDEDNEATYCPEDNKLRLYVGRVPRDEFLALRGEGWTSTPKQDCDFVAKWTTDRLDTCLSYAGEVDDEDQDPQDRAADRAERFAGYRDKRTDEALGHADRYDEGPSAHGYQSKAKGVRAADRHDKQASKALTQWDKAEYWTSRTAGVISNALYKSLPSVRMGRIKILETELRRFEASPEYYGRWIGHTRNRISYENAMLDAVGGRAAVVEMVKGGTYGGSVITRVIKSKASGNVTSVKVIHKASNSEFCYNIEREKAGAYLPPTDESKAALAEFVKARAAAAKVANAGKPKLINPTLKDAKRLQKLWNATKKNKSKYADKIQDQEVLVLTQAQYANNSKGSYAHLGTILLALAGQEQRKSYYTYAETDERPTVCKIRKGPSQGDGMGYYHYSADRVIHISDKPAKALPADTWKPDPAISARKKVLSNLKRLEKLWRKRDEGEFNEGDSAFWRLGVLCGLVQDNGFHLSETAHTLIREAKATV